MPTTVVSFVQKYIHVMDSRTIRVMIKDIERSLSDETLPHRGDWAKLCDDLKNHYSGMIKASEKQTTEATE